MINRRSARKVRIPEKPEEAYKNALRTALNIVAYKDNTEWQLKEKLTDRGYDGETVAAVIEYMKEKHFLNEDRMLIHAVRSMALTKLYGKARIRQELSKKNFARETVMLLDWESEELCDLDFSEICRKLLAKRGGQRDEKTYAFLRRYGHSSSDIRKAYEALAAEDDGDES